MRQGRFERTYTTRAQGSVTGGFLAVYRNRFGAWRTACDALGRPIKCETIDLALSVAGYRWRRLQPLEAQNG